MSELVTRLHQALIDALIEDRPHALDQPVTVAEIYQDLIPYRSVRSTLGFALNADYEHALLELLAGEDGLVRIEPVEVREELRRELETPNPNVGMFRNYAACDVFVDIPERRFDPAQPVVETVSPPPPPEPRQDPKPRTGRDDVSRIQDALPHPPRFDELPFELPASQLPPVGPAVADRAKATPPAARQEARAPAPPVPAATPVAAAGTGAESCVSCGRRLPEHRKLRFCPFCGGDQSQRPCASCGELLESDWQFCVACGAPN